MDDPRVYGELYINNIKDDNLVMQQLINIYPIKELYRAMGDPTEIGIKEIANRRMMKQNTQRYMDTTVFTAFDDEFVFILQMFDVPPRGSSNSINPQLWFQYITK